MDDWAKYFAVYFSVYIIPQYLSFDRDIWESYILFLSSLILWNLSNIWYKYFVYTNILFTRFYPMFVDITRTRTKNFCFGACFVHLNTFSIKYKFLYIMSSEVVEWSCSRCQSIITDRRKYCSTCHSMLKWTCIGSGRSGLYTHFFRHRDNCIHCMSEMDDKPQKVEEKEIAIEQFRNLDND